MRTAGPVNAKRLAFHKGRIRRIMDAAANRHITITGQARLVTVSELAKAMTDREWCDFIRSAYILVED